MGEEGRRQKGREEREREQKKILFDPTNFSSYEILDNYLIYEISSYSKISYYPLL